MGTPLELSVVRFWSHNSKVIGAGFLVSQKHILTCAHVIALGIARNTVEMPDAKVNLDFPLLAAKHFLTARVVLWLPLNQEELLEDIAGLELEEFPSKAAQPYPWVSSKDLWGHHFRVFGFPEGQSNGVWASGELRSETGNGWVHLEDVKQAGYRLEPGFSGAPVWDSELQGIAGMAVAADPKRPEAKTAFMIPTKKLFEAWPDLDGQKISQPIAELEYPEGPVPLKSEFYIEHPTIESDYRKEILKSGALILIKAPQEMGKTSLMERILYHGTTKGYKTVRVDFRMAEDFTNLDKFLRWFCLDVTKSLRLGNKLADYWYEDCGSKTNCKSYFEDYILPSINQPLVLGLDNVDLIFPYQIIADDFFSLLRAWHEYGKNMPTWQKLRLVIVHSKEAYVLRDRNQSPFNVGLQIEVPAFNQEQVWKLVQRHGINWIDKQVNELMAMVDGHPYLLRMALYRIARCEITLEEFLQIAPTEEGLYCEHLRRHLLSLENNQDLLLAIQQVVAANQPVQINSHQARKLFSLGLVKKRGNNVLPTCDLYRQYFRDRLRVS
jgi:AAA-like domain/Trypsin-like peptidase domain